MTRFMLWFPGVLLVSFGVPFSSGQIAIQPPYNSNYSFVNLGAVPGVPPSYGGLTFKAGDPNTILIGGGANAAGGLLYAIGVLRGSDKHITNFTGTAAFFANAANNDGGVAYGPGNVLFLARWNLNQLGQTKPGSTNTDKIIDLGALGVSASPGGLNFVPPGFPGAGQLKVMGYSDYRFYTAALAPDGSNTFNITSVKFETQIQGGPEGFVYVPPGSPLFRDFMSLLVSEYQSGMITAYEINTNGAPVLSTRKVFIAGLSGAEGAATDPLTGDFLFSTFGGGNQVIVVRGFNAPPSADLSIAVAATPDPVTVGSNLTFTVTATNKGPATASSVTVTDTLPAGVKFVSASSTQGNCSNAGGTVTCGLGSLTNGANVRITIVVAPTAGGPITNQASIAASEIDPNPANNAAGQITMVRGTTITAEDGDWSARYVILTNTPEAELMVRTGDIDNLNFGWPAGFNPFSGKTTPSHSFPWTVDPLDPSGTDRIMVLTSYNGNTPAGRDGYTTSTTRPANSVQAIVLTYTLNNRPVNAAVLQMFVDDFQAPVWRASYKVVLNGVRAPFLESIINALVQTGPVGRLITAQVPAEFLPLVRSGRLSITIDDLTTGAGDGYAIDFVKLLINPGALSQTGAVSGAVVDGTTQAPISNVLVSAGGTVQVRTDVQGRYTLTNVPAGLVVVQASRIGFASESKPVDLIAGQSVTVNFSLAARVTPAITQQPRNQTVAPGSAVTLSVTATGTPPLSYQWRLNGVNLPGATGATHAIPNFQIANAGRYRVTVANEVGTVDSQVAILASANLASLPLTNNFGDRVIVTDVSRAGGGSNVGATQESGEPLHADKPGGRSMWITWVAPATGIATFTTAGSGFDTLLAIYTGESFDSFTEIASDDDEGGFQTSRVGFNAVAGTRYQIAVDGFAGAQGDIALSWSLEPVLETLPPILTHPASQTAALGANVTFSVVTSGAGLSYQWFFNKTPISGAINTSLILTNVQRTNVGFYFVRVSRGTRFVDSHAAVLQVNRTALGTVVERVLTTDKFADLVRTVLNLRVGPEPAGVSDRPRRRASLARGYSGTQIFNTFGSVSEEGEPNHCGVAGGASQWFAYQAESGGQLTITTDGSEFDTVLAVYTGEGGDFASLVSVACDNDGGLDGRDSRVSFDAVAGTIYYVAVDGVNGATGNVQLNYDLTAPPHLRLLSGSGGGFPGLKMTGQPGRIFTIEGSTNLLNWATLLTTNVPAGILEFPDPNAPAFGQRYYRATVQP